MSQNYLGGSAKDLKRYPTILSYIEAHHTDLYDIVNDLVMMGSFSSKYSPITFILPDKDVMKTLKSTYTSEPEEAVEIISAHILRESLSTINDWAQKKDNIANARKMKLPVKSVDASKVTLSNDTTLTLDKDFVPFKGREGMSVWIAKGPVPYKDLVKASPKTEVKKGGIETSTFNIEFVEGLIDKWLKEDVPAGKNDVFGCAINCIYEEAKKLGDLRAQRALEWLGVLNPFSVFMALANPYTSKEYFISPVLIDNAVVSIKNHLTDKPASSYKRIIEDVKSEHTKPLEDIRERMRDALDATTANKVQNMYRELSTTNCLGNAKNVYPEEVHNVLKANPDLLLAIHFFYFVVETRMLDIGTDVNEAKILVEDIKNYLNFRNLSHMTLFKTGGDAIVDHSSVICGAHEFVGSCDFLRTCNKSGEYEGYDKTRHDRLVNGSDEEFKLSEGCKEELKYYWKLHSKLPTAEELGLSS